MYIETRFYNNGGAEARMRRHRPVNDPDDHTGKYDFYVEDVDSLEEWMYDNLEIELDDMVGLILDLDAGKWVDITPYI